jgi:hypothetical protein
MEISIYTRAFQNSGAFLRLVCCLVKQFLRFGAKIFATSRNEAPQGEKFGVPRLRGGVGDLRQTARF